MPVASSKLAVVGDPIPNLPWQDRPADCPDVVWRYDANPIIPRNPFAMCNSCFNSAAVPYEGGFAGVFRCDDRRRKHCLHVGRSDNGIDWNIDPKEIEFICADEEIRYVAGYDPRVTWIEDRYYVQWCNGYHGPTIGLAWTKDFKQFHQLENAFLPFNRNGVLFPRKINGQYVMLSRPSDNRHTAFGEIYLSHSDDLEYWGKHRWVMGTAGGWQGLKIGPGPAPIETSEGWLMIYHGVLLSCNGYVYSFGAALLDLDEPWKVIARAHPYLMSPWMDYECVGDVPNVVFPCATLVDPASDRMAIYYGAADTVTAMCFAHVSEMVDFVKTNAMKT